MSAVFGFAESLRPEAGQVVDELRGAGVQVEVLTGDHAQRGGAIARALSVATFAELTPEDKIEHIERLRREADFVGMVGDGLNDAPALASADVGIAMGCGADVARESAAVCLLGDDLRAVPWAVRLARRTVRTIKLNLCWPFFYSLIGMSFAVAGKLNPIIAAGAMVASSLFVVTNSLRLGGDQRSAVSDQPV